MIFSVVDNSVQSLSSYPFMRIVLACEFLLTLLNASSQDTWSFLVSFVKDLMISFAARGPTLWKEEITSDKD